MNLEGKGNEIQVGKKMKLKHQITIIPGCLTKRLSTQKIQEFVKTILSNKVIEQSYWLKDKYAKSNGRF